MKKKPPKLNLKWLSTVEYPPPAGELWLSTVEYPPPVGEFLIFFVVGRVEVGMEHFDALGNRQRFTINGLATAKCVGFVRTEYDDYTHWIPLPSAPEIGAKP